MTHLDRVPPTKIAVLVRDDLAAWQRLNVTAFLSSGIAAAYPDLIGTTYEDAAGQAYLPLLGHPVLVFQASAAVLSSARERAVTRGIAAAVYVDGMFATGNDADNRAVVAGAAGPELDLVGLAVHGPRNVVDRIVKGAVLHP